MPFVVRLYIKTAFLHLILSLALWMWKGLDPVYRPAFRHLFFVGWLLLLIFGVAHWMFPRYRKGTIRDHEGWVAAAYPLLVGGLWFRVVGEPMVMGGRASIGIRWMLVAGGWMQFLGVVLVIATLWPRVRATGRKR